MAIEVKGIEDLLSKFEELERKAKKELTDKALEKGGDVILKAQKVTVPKDTGALAASLDKKQSGQTMKIGNLNAGTDEVRYGYYQEYGTTVMPGKKWMKQAWQNSVSDANDSIKEVIREELKV